MKQNLIAKSLLAGTGVSENDAARLTLEAIETLGELATGTSRPAQGSEAFWHGVGLTQSSKTHLQG